jgi:hypothetical protein
MTEVFQPKSLYCDVGKTTATIFVNGGELVDGAKGYVSNPCDGCVQWSRKNILKVEQEATEEHGGDYPSDRINRLGQLLVDRSRFKGGKSKIVVSMCSPFRRV